MEPQAIDQAVRLLIAARRSGQLLAALPPECQPTTVEAAHAVQNATASALQEEVVGWKISVAPDGSVMRGVLLRSRVLPSPASLPAAMLPLLGVEAEIAFRFDRALAPRGHDYSAAEVSQAVSAVAVIEVVDTRFTSYANTPPLQRLADCMSNGALVVGSAPANWREFDLARLHVSLTIDGKTIVDQIGGHPTVDPMKPALALVNVLRARGGVPAGCIMTTGTYTGLNHAKPGQTVEARFEGFGSSQLTFTA